MPAITSSSRPALARRSASLLLPVHLVRPIDEPIPIGRAIEHVLVQVAKEALNVSLLHDLARVAWNVVVGTFHSRKGS